MPGKPTARPDPCAVRRTEQPGRGPEGHAAGAPPPERGTPRPRSPDVVPAGASSGGRGGRRHGAPRRSVLDGASAPPARSRRASRSLHRRAPWSSHRVPARPAAIALTGRHRGRLGAGGSRTAAATAGRDGSASGTGRARPAARRKRPRGGRSAGAAASAPPSHACRSRSSPRLAGVPRRRGDRGSPAHGDRGSASPPRRTPDAATSPPSPRQRRRHHPPSGERRSARLGSMQDARFAATIRSSTACGDGSPRADRPSPFRRGSRPRPVERGSQCMPGSQRRTLHASSGGRAGPGSGSRHRAAPPAPRRPERGQQRRVPSRLKRLAARRRGRVLHGVGPRRARRPARVHGLEGAGHAGHGRPHPACGGVPAAMDPRARLVAEGGDTPNCAPDAPGPPGPREGRATAARPTRCPHASGAARAPSGQSTAAS